MEFTLRPWRAADKESLVRHANNKHIADNLRDGFPHPYTETDAEAYLDVCLQHSPGRDFRAIAVEDQAVGGIGITYGEDVHRLTGELGYWLAEPWWGKGIVTRAVLQICRETFAQTSLVRIFAEPYEHNTASRRVLEKAGFTQEGLLRNHVIKNGEIMGCWMYALLKEDISCN